MCFFDCFSAQLIVSKYSINFSLQYSADFDEHESYSQSLAFSMEWVYYWFRLIVVEVKSLRFMFELNYCFHNSNKLWRYQISSIHLFLILLKCYCFIIILGLFLPLCKKRKLKSEKGGDLPMFLHPDFFTLCLWFC